MRRNHATAPSSNVESCSPVRQQNITQCSHTSFGTYSSVLVHCCIRSRTEHFLVLDSCLTRLPRRIKSTHKTSIHTYMYMEHIELTKVQRHSGERVRQGGILLGWRLARGWTRPAGRMPFVGMLDGRINASRPSFPAAIKTRTCRRQRALQLSQHAQTMHNARGRGCTCWTSGMYA